MIDTLYRLSYFATATIHLKYFLIYLTVFKTSSESNTRLGGSEPAECHWPEQIQGRVNITFKSWFVNCGRCRRYYWRNLQSLLVLVLSPLLLQQLLQLLELLELVEKMLVLLLYSLLRTVLNTTDARSGPDAIKYFSIAILKNEVIWLVENTKKAFGQF